MKKLLVGMFLFAAAVGVGVIFLENEWHRDRGEQIGIAAGNPSSESLELNVVISRQMVTRDPPAHVAESGAVLWQEWVPAHFELTDQAGQRVSMQRAGTSSIINPRKAFNPEFYLTARVKPGGTYTLDYIPTVGATQRYRYIFTVPPEKMKYERVYFEPA